MFWLVSVSNERSAATARKNNINIARKKHRKQGVNCESRGLTKWRKERQGGRERAEAVSAWTLRRGRNMAKPLEVSFM